MTANSIFSVVATPIGNLGDITLRALDTLKNSDLILCEDTRVTKRLLARHGIDKPMLSYHAHSRLSRVDEIVDKLQKGLRIALVSDAGTPGISDPGSELLRIIRRELADDIGDGRLKIEAIPGPSALAAALSVAGVPCADFIFLGFLPHKKGRETLFKEISTTERTVVFYESPHRILRALESLAKYLRQDQNVTVCRELTKVFEEVTDGTADEVMAYFRSDTQKVKGEFVVIVSEKRPK